MSFCKKCEYRTKETDDCPFGLPITEGCTTAGNAIDLMIPLDVEDNPEKKKLLKAINKKLLRRNQDKRKCPYADKVGQNLRGVSCIFDVNDHSSPSVGLNGSPLYPSIFQGLGGMFSYPMQNVTEYYDNTFRNNPFGLFSLQGSDGSLSDREMLHKLASINFPSKATIGLYGMVNLVGEIQSIDYNAIDPILKFKPDDNTISKSSVINSLLDDNKNINIYFNDITKINVQES